MTKTLVTFLFLISMIAASCTTSRSTISRNVDLSRYEYASIINNDTYHIPAQLMEYEIQLFDAVENSGLQLVSEARIYELSQSQRERLLLVKYGVDVKPEATVVIVNFIDYSTGRPVVSCQGSYSSLGVASVSHDMKSAINQVSKKISETFHK